MLDAVPVTPRVDAIRTGEAAARVEEFRTRLDRISRQRSNAGDLATARAKRLLRELNAASAQAEGPLSSRVVDATPGHVEAELA